MLQVQGRDPRRLRPNPDRRTLQMPAGQMSRHNQARRRRIRTLKPDSHPPRQHRQSQSSANSHGLSPDCNSGRGSQMGIYSREKVTHGTFRKPSNRGLCARKTISRAKSGSDRKSLPSKVQGIISFSQHKPARPGTILFQISTRYPIQSSPRYSSKTPASSLPYHPQCSRSADCAWSGTRQGSAGS